MVGYSSGSSTFVGQMEFYQDRKKRINLYKNQEVPEQDY